MLYKTNALSTLANIEEPLFANEIKGIYVGNAGGTAVFDYTRFFEENNKEYIDYKVFMNANKLHIQRLADAYEKQTNAMFFQNTNGHILVDTTLIFLFLAYADAGVMVYFNELIKDVISEGAAYSNGFIISMVAERIPAETLSEIANQISDENQGGE